MVDTDSTKAKKHGGARKGAGRKATGKADTVVIRLPRELLPVAQALRKVFKDTGIIPNACSKLKDVTLIQEGPFKPLLPRYGAYSMDEFKRLDRKAHALKELALSRKDKAEAYDDLKRRMDALVQVEQEKTQELYGLEETLNRVINERDMLKKQIKERQEITKQTARGRREEQTELFPKLE